MGVYVNQAGYLLKGEKRAVLTSPSGRFFLEDDEGKEVYRGEIREFGFDRSSGDRVGTADFSEFEVPGVYRVCAEGDAENGSAPEKSLCFPIGGNVYDRLLHDLMKAYYFLRCGCELKPEYAGEYVHAACHTGYASEWENPSVKVEVSGGWHDAGDYGRYITPGACALAHLLYAYKMFPKTMKELRLQIPESGSGTPDVLSECRVELEWFLKMQKSDGGVYHKASTARHAVFVMPEEDREPLYVLPVSSMATADLAAVCALASAIYRPYDGAFADKLAQAAEKSYQWLKENPEFLGFRNPPGCGTGEYGERDDLSNRFWAAAELYALTGEERYHRDLEKALEQPFPLAALGYGDVGGFGLLAYLLSGQKQKEELRERFLEAFVQEAAQRVRVSEACGYGVSMMEWEYFWGSNMGRHEARHDLCHR